ncbi:MAG TPA: hypothetical protein VFW33_03315, partial [Gemmataceae bacterium]|nr:hypothetical protein [Gemmataceae bacterium]
MATVAPFLADLYNDASLRSNCSGFFKAVAKKLGLQVPDVTADALIDSISAGGTQWIKIGQGSDSGSQAATFAGQGYLVVALLKAADHLPFKLNKATGKYDISHPYHHGHMAIVLP